MGSVQWLLSNVVTGVTITIEASQDRRAWQDMGTVTNAVAGEWQTIDLGTGARYIRLTIKADNRDELTFDLAEIVFSQ